MENRFLVKQTFLQTEFTGLSVNSVDQMMEMLPKVPIESILYHATNYFFSDDELDKFEDLNDFASWARAQLRDPALVEELNLVSLNHRTNLEAFRDEILEQFRYFAKKKKNSGMTNNLDSFYFSRWRIFQLSTGLELTEINDLKSHLNDLSKPSLYYYFIMTPRLNVHNYVQANDLISWIEHLTRSTNLINFTQLIPLKQSFSEFKEEIITILDNREISN